MAARDKTEVSGPTVIVAAGRRVRMIVCFVLFCLIGTRSSLDGGSIGISHEARYVSYVEPGLRGRECFDETMDYELWTMNYGLWIMTYDPVHDHVFRFDRRTWLASRSVTWAISVRGNHCLPSSPSPLEIELHCIALLLRKHFFISSPPPVRP
jgi:hypothetical protein